MMRTEVRHVLFVLLTLFSISSASAETRSFRCKNDLVSLGGSKSTVLQKCGEPVLKDDFCKFTEAHASTDTRTHSAVVVSVDTCQKVDEWTYNPGRGQFMTSLQFESGKLVSIKYGDRVK